MADAEPPFEQRLRAEGAEQRDVHRGGDDPPDTEAAGEGSVNLTKQPQMKEDMARAIPPDEYWWNTMGRVHTYGTRIVRLYG